MNTLTKPYPSFVLCLFLLLLIAPVLNAQDINTTRVTLKLKDASLREAMQEIETLTEFSFLAKAEDVEKVLHITINVTNQPLGNVLKKIFSGTGLDYRVSGSNIIVSKSNTQGVTQNEGAVNRQRFFLHGTIRSQNAGELIIGATIAVTGRSTGTTSNEYGFYSLGLAPGNYELQISAIGMKTRTVDIDLRKDQQLDLIMEEQAKSLEEVTVVSAASSTRRSLRNPQMSMERINLQEIKSIPVLFGERDILKTMQLLPGVKSAGEGNSGFYVRGGAADQNLVLLDEAPVYNASHLLGFFSTFNSDAIKNVTLYKGAMPPQYGGRLSSVVDIKMNDGNNQQFGVNGGIGLIASRLTIEGPIQKDKSSFLLSGRRTYADVFLKLFGDSALKKSSLYFYDLNAKMNFILGEKDRIYFSGYFGRDVLSQDQLAGINWGNATGTLRWNHVFNNKLFSNTSFIYSNYDYKINSNDEATNYQIFSSVRDWNIKEEMQWYIAPEHTLNFGFNTIYHTLKPGEISVTGTLGTVPQGLPDRYSLENALYAGYNQKISEKWRLSLGLRLSAFTILGEGDYYNVDADGKVTDTLHYQRGEIVKTYINPEPRVAASYQLDPSTALKISYTRNTQHLHLISNSTSASPTDKWVANTNIIKPGIADQFAIGYYKNIHESAYELTVEAYYKLLQNQIDYRNGAQVFTNQAIETQLLYGRGRAYGIEWLIKKKTGKFNGWISYTLSKTERQIADINSGEWYNVKQDRPHDIAIVAIYQLNRKWLLSANWVYYIGDAVTYPAGKYTLDGEVYFHYSKRNAYRMPDYHRLDLGATLQLKQRKKFSSELSFSLFNAYGRANAYQISFRESEVDPNKTEAVQTSLFTFVPSISYNFKF